MIAPVGRPLNSAYWLLTPLAIALAATLLLALPVKAWGLQPPEPVFAFVPAFAWGVVRPSALPPLLLLAAGLLLDLIWGAPAGLWAVCLLFAYGLTLGFRGVLTGQGFVALWIWYLAACAVAFAVGYVFVAAKTGQAPGLVGVALQFAVTGVLFPFAWRMIERYEEADGRYR